MPAHGGLRATNEKCENQRPPRGHRLAARLRAGAYRRSHYTTLKQPYARLSTAKHAIHAQVPKRPALRADDPLDNEDGDVFTRAQFEKSIVTPPTATGRRRSLQLACGFEPVRSSHATPRRDELENLRRVFCRTSLFPLRSWTQHGPTKRAARKAVIHGAAVAQNKN